MLFLQIRSGFLVLNFTVLLPLPGIWPYRLTVTLCALPVHM